MLTIAKLRPGREDYYLNKVAAGIEDYYTGKGEIAGRWMGRGAARLGLTGEVAASQLRAALGGLNPVAGERLVGKAGAKRVPGWDLTFAAPKPVSVLYGLGDADASRQVVESHEMAVAEAVRYLERHATVSRRRFGHRIHQVRGEGLVIAAFRHRTSRAGDPHLHTHALAANVVEHVDGGWGALHSPVAYRYARTAGFVYQAVLRGELTERLGVTWGPIHNGYAAIDGIDQRLIDCFSKRHTDIAQELGGVEDASRRAVDVAQRRTRTAKRYEVDPHALHRRWHAEVRALGFDADTVVASATGAASPTVTDLDLEWIIDTMTEADGLTARQATFERQDAARAWCESLPAGLKVSYPALEDLTDLALADPRVVALSSGETDSLADDAVVCAPDGAPVSPMVTRQRWTTTEMLATERDLLERAVRGRDVGAGRVTDEIVEAVLAGRADLSPEQATVVRRLATSGDSVDVVVGRAGAGKTYTMAAAAEVWRAAGYKPMGIALAARAAAELEGSAGIPSTTVAQFLIDADTAPSGLLTETEVVVVDEAGMIDTRRLARVLRHAGAAGAKVVLVGDHHQLPAVEAGGAFAALVARLAASELTENRRQVEQWERDTLDRLRGGGGGRDGIAEVVTIYGDNERIHIGPTPADVRAAMVTDWYDARRAGAKVGMVALRRGDVDELNTRARALLVADGSVAAEGITVAGRTYASGDRVVCLENDRRIGVHNALFAHVIGVDRGGGSLTIAVENTGQRLVVPFRYIEDGHLAHGYATTIHKAQGATYQRTLLLGDDRLYRQAGYTALSRGSHRNDMYLVADDDRDRDPDLDRYGHAPPDKPVQRLVAALDRDGAKVLASSASRVGPGNGGSGHRPLREMWLERDELAAVVRGENRRLVRDRGTVSSQVRLSVTGATLNRQHNDGADLREPGADDGRGDLVKRLADLDRAIDLRARHAGRAAEIQHPAYIVDFLGDPPASMPGRERWRNAAAEIMSYRARWDVNPVKLIEDSSRVPDEQVTHLEQVNDLIAATVDPPDASDAVRGLDVG